MSMFIKTPFKGNREIIIFNHELKKDYSLTKDSHLVYNKIYSETQAANKNISFKGYIILGYLSELKDDNKKLLRFISENGLDIGELSPTEYITKLVISDNDLKFSENLIFIPKFTPKLNGKKKTIKVDLKQTHFNDIIKGSSNVCDIDIYCKEFDENADFDTEYSCYIPDFIYDELHNLNEKELIPDNKIIKSTSIVQLKKQLLSHVDNIMEQLYLTEKMKRTTKMIAISYKSNLEERYDDFNHAIIGNDVNFGFRYYILYKTQNTSSIFNDSIFFSKDKKISNTGLNSNKINNGYNIIKEYSINQRGEILIEWTQEREDYLKEIEKNFTKIKNNLDNFMSKLNEKEIDLLLSNNVNLFLNK